MTDNTATSRYHKGYGPGNRQPAELNTCSRVKFRDEAFFCSFSFLNEAVFHSKFQCVIYNFFVFSF